jgi:hypothetical protein
MWVVPNLVTHACDLSKDVKMLEGICVQKKSLCELWTTINVGVIYTSEKSCIWKVWTTKYKF